VCWSRPWRGWPALRCWACCCRQRRLQTCVCVCVFITRRLGGWAATTSSFFLLSLFMLQASASWCWWSGTKLVKSRPGVRLRLRCAASCSHVFGARGTDGFVVFPEVAECCTDVLVMDARCSALLPNGSRSATPMVAGACRVGLPVVLTAPLTGATSASISNLSDLGVDMYVCWTQGCSRTPDELTRQASGLRM
jgi:hypothetical protein